MKLVIFDLDGTLFRTETVDVVAINRALVSNGYTRKDESEILQYIGMTLDDVCISLINTRDSKIIEQLKKDIIKFEKDEVQKHGKLYDDVMYRLTRLKRLGFTMCICSNGGEEYIKEISKKFNFNELFDYISFNDCTLTKSQRVGIIKDKYSANQFIMVGDRTSDIEAARDHNGISIGVTYGFGKNEVLNADYVANDFKEVETIIVEISSQ